MFWGQIDVASWRHLSGHAGPQRGVTASHNFTQAMVLMNRTLLAIVFCMTALQACAHSSSWGFIQAVGGMAIGTPKQENGEWSLPVTVDVSGLTTVTAQPTTLNSALICEKTVATVKGHNIYLAVFTRVAGGSHTSKCPPAKLGSIPTGNYRVFYRVQNESPIALGELRVGP